MNTDAILHLKYWIYNIHVCTSFVRINIYSETGRKPSAYQLHFVLCLSCNVKTTARAKFKSKLQKQTSFQLFSVTASYRSLYINQIPGDGIQARYQAIVFKPDTRQLYSSQAKSHTFNVQAKQMLWLLKEYQTFWHLCPNNLFIKTLG
jgi:hypothetical protein